MTTRLFWVPDFVHAHRTGMSSHMVSCAWYGDMRRNVEIRTTPNTTCWHAWLVTIQTQPAKKECALSGQTTGVKLSSEKCREHRSLSSFCEAHTRLA